MIVKITNARGGKFVFNWQIERNGEWKSRGFELGEFALAQEVSFIDKEDYEFFQKIFSDLFDSGAILVGKVDEAEAQKKSEKVNNAEGKKLRDKSDKVTEAMIEEAQKAVGEDASIQLTVSQK